VASLECGGDGIEPPCSQPDGNTPEGVCDLAGNVLEWVADSYGFDYYCSAPAADPAGPAPTGARSARGGSWYEGGGMSRAAYRFSIDPAERSIYLGFRCAGAPSAP
jgi:formylglycine-generating enzyme required for sulfatase activity